MRALPPAPTTTVIGETLSGTGAATVDVVVVVVVAGIVVAGVVVVADAVVVVVACVVVLVVADVLVVATGDTLLVANPRSRPTIGSPASSAAGAGPVPLRSSRPQVAVAAATTVVRIPPARITMKS
jgi:hypothetical protein